MALVVRETVAAGAAVAAGNAAADGVVEVAGAVCVCAAARVPAKRMTVRDRFFTTVPDLGET
jgi:hypothetical protein